MKLKVEALKTGKWKLKDGRTYSVDSAKVEHHAGRLRHLLSRGYVIPYAIEHDELGKPLTESEWTEKKDEFLGRLEAVETDAKNKTMHLILNIEDPKNAKYSKGMRFVSPEILTGYQLGGEVLAGETITHIAATALPCQFPQTPSQVVELSRTKIWLSLDGYEPEEKAPKGEDDEPVLEDKGEGDGAPEPTDKEGRLKEVLALLEQLKIVMPQDTDCENLLERLHTALLTKLEHGGGSEEQQPGNEPEAEPMPESNNPVIMSLTEKTLMKKLIGLERKDLESRVKALFETGRIGRPTRDKLKAELAKVQLSMSRQTGELTPTKVVSQIEAYEELPEGSAFPVVDGVQLSRAELPAEAEGRAPQSNAEVDKAVDEWEKTTNGTYSPVR